MVEQTAEQDPHYGRIEVIFGPMFSGKSEELIRRLIRARDHGHKKVQAFYPYTDDRGKRGTINTANGEEYPAIEVLSSKGILEKIEPGVDIVGIDEAQFFDMELTHICIGLAKMGKIVIVSGLAADFKNDSFGPMGGILAIAEASDRRTAYCDHCGAVADRTQRLVKEPNGTIRVARRDEDVVVVGGKINDIRGRSIDVDSTEKKAVSIYEARCHDCHEVAEPLEEQ